MAPFGTGPGTDAGTHYFFLYCMIFPGEMQWILAKESVLEQSGTGK